MGHSSCCVVLCKNTSRNSKCKFYRFPTASWKIEQRKKWIAAVKRKNADGSPWYPKPSDLICSDHFIGGKKADEMASASYVPTIFPTVDRSNIKIEIEIENIYLPWNRKIRKNYRPKTAKMNIEKTPTVGVTDIKVEKESDDEVESETHMYADHNIKEEMVIGPEVLQRAVNATNDCEDLRAPKKPRLEVKDKKTKQVEPHQKEIITYVIKKKRKKVGNKEQTKCYNLRKYNPTPGISHNEVEIKGEMIIGI